MTEPTQTDRDRGGPRRTPKGSTVEKPQEPASRKRPGWIWLLAGAIALVAVLSYFIVGTREEVRTADELPQEIGPQGEQPPVVSPTPANPAPPPQPATPARPPVPVE